MNTQQKGKHIHMIGIGGSGISAIARVLLERGFVVSGSDEQLTHRTADLLAAGATIHRGHKAAHIQGAQMVVFSSAVPDTNPELQAARRAGIPTLKRPEILGSLMAMGNSRGIAVAGTHGKTTTTGMIAHILLAAQQDPSVVLGDELPSMGSNGRSGQGKHFVVEADEYDQMFLGLSPKVAVVTNVEYDHPDSYPTRDQYRQAFREFIRLLPDDGRLVICAEDPYAVQLLKVHPNVERIAYGIGFPITPAPGLNLLLAQNLTPNAEGGTDFDVEHNMEPLGQIRLRVPGAHNVQNALAATAVTLYEGVDFDAIAQALDTFGGVERRFELRGRVGDITVIDDYAHHPTEIQTTLAAARQRFPSGRLWAVWQPHTYSRVKVHLPAFATCFEDADFVIALDVFPSREKDSLGIQMPAVVSKMKHKQARHIGDRAAAAAHLVEQLQPGDVVITLNAGDARVMGDWLLRGLSERLGQPIEKPPAAHEPARRRRPSKQFELDATPDQVRRLVDRLRGKRKK